MTYEPFERGGADVVVESTTARDAARDRTFPCEVWRPRRAARSPLILYSHSSGGDRRSATFLCEHLASHGYVVGALDHSERVADDRPEDLEERIAWLIRSRVPDVLFLLDYLAAGDEGAGLVGHSFGGWTVLAVPEVDPRIESVVAHAPGGSSNPRPGIIPAKLSFAWARVVPTLVVAGDRDVSIPLAGVRELVERMPEPKRLVVLRDADHMHFVDDVAAGHEAMREMPAEGDLAWIAEMRPLEELRPPEVVHRLVRGLTLAHFDATLRGNDAARAFLGAMSSRDRRL